MGLIQGIPVVLTVKREIGADEFKRPIYEETKETITNVLVGEASADEIKDSLSLYGKKVLYTLAIPKGDTHVWEDTTVEFFGEKFQTIGAPVQGIENNIPLEWNKKVKVGRYE